MKPISLSLLEVNFAALLSRGVPYAFGGKADERQFNPRSIGKLSTPPDTIDGIDCSGAVRYWAYQASGGGLILPDGSQMQREWCEQQAAKGQLHKVAKYSDAAEHMTSKRLFICFIKPFVNGCGDVGHVWFLRMRNGRPMTVESHGRYKGVDSRPWNYSTLLNQVYSVYELPTTA